MTRRLSLWLLLACASLPTHASAHGLAPILVRVDEAPGARVEVRWSVTTTGAGMGLTNAGSPLVLQLPEHCVPVGASRAQPGVRLLRSLERYRCATPLAGETLRIVGLPQSDQAVVLRHRGPDGREASRTLSGSDDSFTLTADARALDAAGVLRRYVQLGFAHILSGFDHLAFVACLALVAGRLGALLWAVTAFTVAHSLTLALGALSLVQLPGPPVEACIALSVLFMAARAARSRGEAPESAKTLSLATFGFGLLHGLGFAGALSEVGFSGASLAVSLAGFNLGVELGQLCVLATLYGSARTLAALARDSRLVLGLRQLAVQALGILAGFWVIERLASLLSLAAA